MKKLILQIVEWGVRGNTPLSVSQGIMAAHGGELVYDETSPRTRFIIRIPRGMEVAK